MSKPHRIQISPETQPGLHKRMIRYIEEVVFPELLEHYWMVCFDTHKQPDYLFVISDPFHDSFKPIEKEGGGGTFTCLVPCLRAYWDIILALYHLYCPKLFPTTAHVAEALFEKIEEARIYNKDPTTDLQNYDADIHSYLETLFKKNKELAGGYHNWFLTDPGECVFQAQRALMLLNKNFRGDETDEFIRSIEVIHQKELIERFKEENDGKDPPEMFLFTDNLKVLHKETLNKCNNILQVQKPRLFRPKTGKLSERGKRVNKEQTEKYEREKSKLSLEYHQCTEEDKDHQCTMEKFD